MSLVFTHRCDRKEWMDERSFSAAQTASIFRDLEWINAWMGGVRATVCHLQRMTRTWPIQKPLRLLDVGTGGGDIPRAIVRWARKSRRPISITAVDIDPLAIDYAQTQSADYPEIQFEQADLRMVSFASESFDIVHSSLCLHHLGQDDIVRLLNEAHRIASYGLIMNDLKRSARAWLWIQLISRLLGMDKAVQHDGPLSVRRAFTSKELMTLSQYAGLPHLRVYTHFGYRCVLVGEKADDTLS